MAIDSQTVEFILERFNHPDLSSHWCWKADDGVYSYHSRVFDSEQSAHDWFPDNHPVIDHTGKLSDGWTSTQK